MHFTSLATVAAFAALAVAAPTNVQRHVLHEKRNIASPNWIKREALHPGVTLPMRIGLHGQNMDKSHDLLMEVSDPDSPKFGKYYTAEEVHDLFAPAEPAVQAVRSWLEKAGVEAHRISQSVNKQWIQLDLSTAEAESLLQTKYHFFENANSGRTTIGCDEYHVHEDVAEHIDYITPGIKLIASNKPTRAAIEKRTFLGKPGASPSPPLLAPLPMSLTEILELPLSAICDRAILPECIMTEYNISKATSAVAGNELGIFEDLGDYYSQTDLNEFFLTLQPRIPQGTHPKLDGIDGAQAPTTNILTGAGAESDLDFQISYPLIWPQNSILFQTDDPVYEANYTYEGFLNNFLDAIDGSYCTYTAYNETGNSPLDPPYPDPAPGGYKGNLQCGVYKPTNVISVSYGGQEADLPYTYQKRQCNEYQKLGMQGISIVFASGDNGVSGPAGDDSSNGCLNGGTVFSPDFPATCPYVTAVGATLLTGNVYQDQETAVTRFASGGGFSNIYSAPSYQTAAIATYFKTAGYQYKYYNQPAAPYYTYNATGAASVPNSNGGVYDVQGRGYPDVSAVGDNVIIFNDAAPTLIGGTSAAAPVFASILTRINDERIKAGKSTIGFVNPTLYKNPQVLHDITVGTNPGCGTNGFTASKGWDPLTGLGTPNYPAMLALFMSLK